MFPANLVQATFQQVGKSEVLHVLLPLCYVATISPASFRTKASHIRALLCFEVSNAEGARAHPQADGGSAIGRDYDTQGLHLRHPGRQRHRHPELLTGPHAAS